MNGFTICVIYFIYIIGETLSADIKGFDDTLLFKVNWPLKDGPDLLQDKPDSDAMVVMTSNKEKYRCLLPTTQDKSKDTEDAYEGPNALDILQPLFSQSSCTYRLESYWTYEVCHGRYVRQYHEDREVRKSKTQEFFLGKWDKIAHEQLSKELDRGLHYPPPVKKLDGLNLPYLQLNMTDGTMCDLNEKPRRTNILYVCYSMGKHEIYSFKETSTCEYELIVLSSLLCQHPKYKPQDTGEHPIHCLPLEGAPMKPRNLRRIETESLHLRHQRILDDERLKKVLAVFSIDKIEKDGENRVRLELRALPETDEETTPATTPATSPPLTPETGPETPTVSTAYITDTGPVENFLSGKSCLQGGSGWWKFEFCYGKSVEQYHVEHDNTRTVVQLGRFLREGHISWLERNPHKRPKPLAERKHVSHHYGAGSFCASSGQPRETEVKLKCVKDMSPGAVRLYLIEPHTCQYILGVESPLVCRILGSLDEYGLIDESVNIDFTTIADADVDDSEVDEIVHDEH